MQSRAFHFLLGAHRCWAQGHPLGSARVTLALRSDDGKFDFTVSMSATEARAAAVALEAAATFAESALPTGLGESAVTS